MLTANRSDFDIRTILDGEDVIFTLTRAGRKPKTVRMHRHHWDMLADAHDMWAEANADTSTPLPGWSEV